MRITGADRASIRLAPQYGGAPAREREEVVEESRAITVIDAPAPADRPLLTAQRPAAAFVAQLIATQMHAPQTRERRRIEPGEGTAVYRSMTKPVAQKRAFGKRA